MQTRKHETIDEEIGTVSISIYQDTQTNTPFFEINTDNDNVEQVAYIIEDALYDF